MCKCEIEMLVIPCSGRSRGVGHFTEVHNPAWRIRMQMRERESGMLLGNGT